MTGAAGFIGSHLTRLAVSQGHDVWAAVSPDGSSERLRDLDPGITVARMDLRDARAIRDLISKARPECAIHLAWYTAPCGYWNALENLDCVTYTLNLARRLAEAGCARFVAAGSCAEYDWSNGDGLLTEFKTPLKPQSLYGACKKATQELLGELCARTSMTFAWARFFYLYGPGEARDRLTPSVIRALLSGETARLTSGNQQRDYLHVEDGAAALWAISQSAVTGPVNVGAGCVISIRQLVEVIAELVGGDAPVEFGALPENSGDPPVVLADVRRLMSVTGWHPAWCLRDGLRQTVEWWRMHTA